MKITKFIVIDSSVAVKWVNIQDERLTDRANQIMQHVQENKFTILMPELAKYEVANALIYKKMEFSLLEISLDDFYHLPISFIPETRHLALSALEIAISNGITYYDATFIALAKNQRADLVTDNPKHQNKYKGKEVRIIPLKDYV